MMDSDCNKEMTITVNINIEKADVRDIELRNFNKFPITNPLFLFAILKCFSY